MKVKSLTIKRLQIPFKVAFEHSSAKRSVSQSVIAIATSKSGLQGFGEGCPRAYVTNEGFSTVESFFESHQKSLLQISSLQQIQDWSKEHAQAIDNNPSAWCAIEVALLDLLGKESNQTIEMLLEHPQCNHVLSFTGVLGISSLQAFQKMLTAYLNLKIKDFKVKLSGDLQTDKELLSQFSSIDNVRVRADANNLWETAEQTKEYLTKLNFPLWAIEEPLKAPCQYEALFEIAHSLDIKIILDESFTQLSQLAELTKYESVWVLNLRLSKLGGLLRTLEIAHDATQRNIPLIVGSHVGETSLLARGAITVANAYFENLLAQEGAFGTYLLKHDIVQTPIMFGEHGQLESKLACFTLPGLGLDITDESP